MRVAKFGYIFSFYAGKPNEWSERDHGRYNINSISGCLYSVFLEPRARGKEEGIVTELAWIYIIS